MKALLKRGTNYLDRMSLRLACKMTEIKGSSELVAIVFMILLVIVIITIIMFPQVKEMLLSVFDSIDIKIDELLNNKA